MFYQVQYCGPKFICVMVYTSLWFLCIYLILIFIAGAGDLCCPGECRDARSGEHAYPGDHGCPGECGNARCSSLSSSSSSSSSDASDTESEPDPDNCTGCDKVKDNTYSKLNYL